MNIQRRVTAVSTRFIIVITSASAAGLMVLGVVLFVLIRCHTKGHRRVDAPRHFSDAHASHSGCANFRESFIQTAPLRFLESSAFTLPVIPEPRRQSLPILYDIPDNINIGHALNADNRSHWFHGDHPGDISQSPISLKAQVDRESRDSIYSNISFPLSQYSLTFGSTNPTYRSTIRPYLPSIPGSPRDPKIPLASGAEMHSKDTSIQLEQKPTEKPSYLMNAASTLPASTPVSSAPMPAMQPSLPATLAQDSDHLSDLPLSGFRRRRSQPNTDPGVYSGHHYLSAPTNASVAESSFENSMINTLPTGSRSQQPNIRPELSISRPHKNYASIAYARARGPAVLGTKWRCRAHAYSPAALMVSDGGAFGVQSMRTSTETFKDQLATAEESSPVTQPSRLNIPSPTWSNFRNSPGWV